MAVFKLKVGSSTYSDMLDALARTVVGVHRSTRNLAYAS